MSETVGAALKAAREQRRLTLAQVSESTRLRTHYLLALENDDISAELLAMLRRKLLIPGNEPVDVSPAKLDQLRAQLLTECDRYCAAMITTDSIWSRRSGVLRPLLPYSEYLQQLYVSPATG